jgi:hypothetical protein
MKCLSFINFNRTIESTNNLINQSSRPARVIKIDNKKNIYKKKLISFSNGLFLQSNSYDRITFHSQILDLL